MHAFAAYGRIVRRPRTYATPQTARSYLARPKGSGQPPPQLTKSTRYLLNHDTIGGFHVPLYGLAPRHCADEAIGFLRAVTGRAALHGPFYMVGDSSGAGLALATTQALISEAAAAPVGLTLIAPGSTLGWPTPPPPRSPNAILGLRFPGCASAAAFGPGSYRRTTTESAPSSVRCTTFHRSTSTSATATSSSPTAACYATASAPIASPIANRPGRFMSTRCCPYPKPRLHDTHC